MAEQKINYFTLLGLNPTDPWDEELFEKALNTKKRQWTRDSMDVIPEALAARQKLDLVDDIRRVMRDSRLRAEHARMHSRTPAEERQQRLIEFDRQMASREAKGYLDEYEIQELVQAFSDVLTEDQIIAQINVQLRLTEPEEKRAYEAARLDLTASQDIKEKLLLLQLSSLYELLKLPMTTSSEELCRSAEQLFREMAQRQPKTTEVSITKSLAGYARSIFSSPQRRQDYDDNLALAALPQKPPAHDSSANPPPEALKEPAPAAPISSTHRETIQQLKVRNMGSALRLSWLWPTDCYEVFVSYNEHRWPTPLQEAGKTIRVTRAFYEERGGYFDLLADSNKHYYIVVSPFIRQQERMIVAPGAQIEGYLMPQASVSYEIRNPRLGYKYRTLHLFIQPPALIPTLLLVMKRNALPLHKADGELLHREEGPLTISLQETVIKLRDGSFPSNTYARLFLEDDSLYSFVIIHLPHEKKLRLG